MNIFAPIALYDRLAGKLFVPLAIKLCRVTRLTQYQLHDYLWMLFYWTLMLVLVRHWHDTSWFILVPGVYVSIYWTCRVARQTYTTPELVGRRPSWMAFQRRALLLAETYHTGVHVLYALGILGAKYAAQASFDISCPMLWYALIADYAVTIRNLPPVETEQRFSETAHQDI